MILGVKSAGLYTGFGNEWLRVGGVKYFADGSASERTMRMSTHYVGRHVRVCHDVCHAAVMFEDADQIRNVISSQPERSNRRSAVSGQHPLTFWIFSPSIRYAGGSRSSASPEMPGSEDGWKRTGPAANPLKRVRRFQLTFNRLAMRKGKSHYAESRSGQPE